MENGKIKLNSTLFEVEVRVELGNNKKYIHRKFGNASTFYTHLVQFQPRHVYIIFFMIMILVPKAN